MKREVLGKAFLETGYLNRDPPEVKMQAIRTPGRSLLQAEGTASTKAMGWEWTRRRLFYCGVALGAASQSCWGHILCSISVGHLVVLGFVLVVLACHL